MKVNQGQKQESIETLREWVTPGDTVHCILRSVSRSGMNRKIDLLICNQEGLSNISWHAAKAAGYNIHEGSGALNVSGCGMDMGFKVVYDLSQVLFPERERAGYQLKHCWI